MEKGNIIFVLLSGVNLNFIFQSDASIEGESVVDGTDAGEMELPGKVVEGTNSQSLGSLPKMPIMDALQDAMQEININSILAPSPSTSALSSLTRDEGTNMKNNLSQRSAVEVFIVLLIPHSYFRVVIFYLIDTTDQR